jgi:hypothetical protein
VKSHEFPVLSVILPFLEPVIVPSMKEAARAPAMHPFSVGLNMRAPRGKP